LPDKTTDYDLSGGGIPDALMLCSGIWLRVDANPEAFENTVPTPCKKLNSYLTKAKFALSPGKPTETNNLNLIEIWREK
jgi:hypothetical protein